jgi:hypothetical protein
MKTSISQRSATMSSDDTTQARTSHILDHEPDMVQPHLENNTALVAQTLDRATHRFVDRLFPGQLGRIVQHHELAQLQTGFEYRRRALQMAVETKLQAVEEMCNHVLVTGKSEIRRKRQEFFAEQKLKLQESINAYAERFHAETDRRFDALAAMRNDYMRSREEERLLRAVDEFHSMIEQLGQEFLEIIREGIKRG